MAKRKTKLVQYHEVYDFVDDYLSQKRLVASDELEAAVAKKFRGRLDVRLMKTRKRLRWENLVDWAKANLTKENAITYLPGGYIAYTGNPLVRRAYDLGFEHGYLAAMTGQ